MASGCCCSISVTPRAAALYCLPWQLSKTSGVSQCRLEWPMAWTALMRAARAASPADVDLRESSLLSAWALCHASVVVWKVYGPRACPGMPSASATVPMHRSHFACVAIRAGV